EGFVEHDIAQTSLEPAGEPDFRKSRSTAALQELYFDGKLGSFFFRLGRQPVRWSQSWTIPSLDVFTGRRWNRLFVDPVPEQLTHPDGVLVSYAGAVFEADLFHAVQPAENTFPQPLPDSPRLIRDQSGARIKLRLGGFDFALVGWRKPEDSLVGGSVSYAFESFVVKAEGGSRPDDAGFGIIGVDYFGNLGDLEITFGPQYTWYKEPLMTGKNVEGIYYLPLRLAYKKTSIETQYYGSAETRDAFGSAMITHEISDYKGASLKASLFHQSYAGEPGRLFSLYESLTGSSLAGLRLDLNYTL
ncbi:MAG: hypothetical protein AAB250_05930, partial [Bdellovibrionota bacterium]